MAKILIVDDEPLITAMMEDWLSELGHLVVGPAHNLATAMELAASEIDAPASTCRFAKIILIRSSRA